MWQLERRAWKLDLIARVETRLAAEPAAPPPQALWAQLANEDIAYRRVVVRGTFHHDRETLVDALTEHGAGFWVLTPLEAEEGIVLVNRGFVPRDRALPASRRAGQVEGIGVITGLLRASEPGGRILRPNNPSHERWYSRDVAAISRARELDRVAPFFIDAGPAVNPGGYPIGGLTVIRFHNFHLVYAATWFGLALLCGAGLVVAASQGSQSPE